MIGGRNTNFQHGSHGATGTLVDYTTSIMSINKSNQAKEANATVFGDGFESYEATFKSGTVDIIYKYSTAMFDVLWAIYDGEDTIDWQLGPNGTGTGEVKLTGSAVLLDVTVPMTVGDIIKINTKWRITGAETPTHF